MKLHLNKFDQPLHGIVRLTSSKSESNRALLINALSGNKLHLTNLSAARDTETMQRLLSEKPAVWDVLDAGTTMRFCTAYLGIYGKGEIITGTPRMKERPIGLLGDALRKLGADIEYTEKEGYPPMKIRGISRQMTDTIEIPGNVSSQFISALLMIGPALPEGITLRLTTEVFSRPYIEMTLALMAHFGARFEWEDQAIRVPPQPYTSGNYQVESDWSGASYWFAMAALNSDPDLVLTGLKEKSFQGDQAIVDIMRQMGIATEYTSEGVRLTRGLPVQRHIEADFKTCPDLAQTVMVAAAVKGITLKMTGLESLRIKETDRISAMQAELQKVGAELIEKDGREWNLTPGKVPDQVADINTYEDHRMAMAFAPVCQVRNVTIHDPDVVRKSYPAYWDDLKKVGVSIS